MAKKILIYVAINGSRYSRSPSIYAPQGVPDIPYTSEEAQRNVAECYELGARLFHVHSRAVTGEHIIDPGWYRQFITPLREKYKDLKCCFATSRSGEAMEQIKMKYQQLKNQMPFHEARVKSELLRLGCIDANPDMITAFTATEVRMGNATADIGHVTDAQPPLVIKDFFQKTISTSLKNNIKHEFEITTHDSVDMIEDLQKSMTFSNPISIVILPGFTSKFQFDTSLLDEITLRLKKIIEKAGGGFITLGRILHPNGLNTELKRQELIYYSYRNPYIDAIRVGIEDGPYWSDTPSTNADLVRKTIKSLKEIGGSIATNINEIVEL